MAIHDIRQIKGFDGSTYIIKDASAIATVTVSNNNLTGTLRGGSTFSVALPGITLSVHGTGNAIGTMSVSNSTIDVSLASLATSGHNHDDRYASTSHSKLADTTYSNLILVSTTDSYKWLNNPVSSAVVGGSGTAAVTTTSGGKLPTGSIWRITLPDVSLYSGLTIMFKVPIAGNGTYGTLLRIDGTNSADDSSLNLYPVCTGVNSMISTRYAVNTIVGLTFDADQVGLSFYYQATTTASSGKYTSVAGGTGWTKPGCWKVLSDYDSGNDKAVAYNVYYTYDRPKAGTSTLSRYKIVALDKDNRVVPITLEDSTGTSKTINTVAFQPDRLYYYNSTTSVNPGGALAASVLYASIATTNCTYTFNESITTYSRVYLCGDFNKKTGLFTLLNAALTMANGTTTKTAATAFTAIVPTGTANINLKQYFATGKYYIFLGESYSSANYLQVEINHPMYYFDGDNLIPAAYTAADKIKVNGEILGTDASGYVNVQGITLADASNGSTGLAIAEDVYTELTNVEEALSNVQNTMANTLGMNNDFSVTWSTASGIPSTVSYREAIEYVSLHSAGSDEKQKVSSTTSKFYITGVTGTPNGTAVEGVANTNAFISGGNKLIIPNVSISTATISTLNGTSVPANPKFTDTVYTHPAATGTNTTSSTTSTVFTVLDTLSKDSSGHVTSVNTKTVTVPEASTANNITAAVTVGYITKNSTIPEGTTLNDLVDMIFNPTLGVTPKNPTVSISNASTSNSGNKEIGSTVNVNFSRTYNDGYFLAVDSWGANQAANCATDGNPIYYYKVTTDSAYTTLSSNKESRQITGNGLTYKVRQYYKKSTTIPVNNKGASLVDVSIAAGYAEATYAYTAKYKYFVGYSNSSAGSTIRSFASNNFITANTVNVPGEFDVPSGNYMIIAVPLGYKLNYIDSGFAGVEVTNIFVCDSAKTGVSLDGTNYKVYWTLPTAETTKFLSIQIKNV